MTSFIGGGGSSSTPALPALPTNIPTPPVFGAPTTKKPGQKSPTPAYIPQSASPSVANTGYKKLIGQ